MSRYVDKRFNSRLLFVAGSLAISVVLYIPSSANSLSVKKYSGRTVVSFHSGSSTLINSSKVQLARHLPRISSLRLEGISIEATGDDFESPSNQTAQMALASARSRSVLQFFTDAGIPMQRIESYPVVIRLEKIGGPQTYGPRLGTVDVNYFGTCKPDYDVAICNDAP